MLIAHDTTVAVASRGLAYGPPSVATRIEHSRYTWHVGGSSTAAAAYSSIPADTTCALIETGLLHGGTTAPKAGAIVQLALDLAIGVSPRRAVPAPPPHPPDVRRALLQLWLN